MDLAANCSSSLDMVNASGPDQESFNLTVFLMEGLGPQRQSLNVVLPITCIYPILFVLGVGGNLLTCVVIYKNSYMHTTTNYYLFSLAVSDVLMLLLGLPLELHSFWHQYPYLFPEFVCSGRALISEMTTNASILTITAFTVERYTAICHPLFAQTIKTLSRPRRIIFLIWLMALAGAAPYAHFLRVSHLNHPDTGQPIPESTHCNVPQEKVEEMFWLLMFSSLTFFILPLIVLSVLYVLIYIALRRSARFDLEQTRTGSSSSDTSRARTQSRRSIVQMLVSVCFAFFICWAPFHAQRLFWASYTLFFKESTYIEFNAINEVLYPLAGCCYYSNSAINVIIYNALSHRFRDAFRETIYRSTCLQRRGLDCGTTHRSGVRSTSPAYRRQSTVPSLPPSRRNSQFPPPTDNMLMELAQQQLLGDSDRTVQVEERLRQDSTDSGVGRDVLHPFELQLVTSRERRIVRMRQISENSVFLASGLDDADPFAVHYRVSEHQSSDSAKHAL